jgi:hypothetical protein
VDYYVVAVAFVVSRLVFMGQGLAFNPDIQWMFLADPESLQTRPFQTLFYFHAFPPGMNVQAALLLGLSAERFAPLAHLSLAAFGLLLTLSVLYLGRALGLSRVVAGVLAIAFALYPASLFLENVFLYTIPAAALLALAAATFHRALASGSRRGWWGFFTACALLGVYRTTYHLIWFAAMAGFALVLSRREHWRAVLTGAVGPGAVLIGLYIKNWVVFGVFGLTSWGGANLVAVTTRQLPRPERIEWIRSGKVSPLVNISAFAPPAAYLGLVPSIEYPWPGTNTLFKSGGRVPNYNHGLFLGVNRQRGRDSRRYVRERPWDYLRTVLCTGVVQYFGPTTRWHPLNDHPDAAHYRHQQALPTYEAAVNAVLHQPVAALRPFGLYTALPAALVWALVCALRGLRQQTQPIDASLTHQSKLLLFLTLQIGFSVAVSCLFAGGENARYRYGVEAFIWLLAAWCGHQVINSVRWRFGQRRADARK